MDGIAFVDGKAIDLKDARVPLNDRGYLLGDGIFETLRTANGEVFQRQRHQERLERGLRAIGLEPEIGDRVAEAIDTLVVTGRKHGDGELYLRINVTTGVMNDVAGTDAGVSVTGICKPFKPYPMQYYSHGVSLIASRFRLQHDSPLAGVKTLSFMPYVAARREAHSRTAHDAVMGNDAGRIAEATTSNIFARHGDIVFAPGPGEGAVDGVTRRVVLELVKDTGFEVVEALELQALESATEAWVTNTTGGVVPVTRFEKRPIGDGKKGDLCTRLGHAYEDLVRGR